MVAGEIMRSLRMLPYVGDKPVFDLDLIETQRQDSRGVPYVAYRLSQDGRTIFEGDDYAPSPMDAIDSLASARGLLTFLTLRPGDTDADYFDDYTHVQRVFANEHAEALSLYASCDMRFDWDSFDDDDDDDECNDYAETMADGSGVRCSVRVDGAR